MRRVLWRAVRHPQRRWCGESQVKAELEERQKTMRNMVMDSLRDNESRRQARETLTASQKEQTMTFLRALNKDPQLPADPQLVDDPSALLHSAAVYPNFLTEGEEDRLGTQLDPWFTSPHATRWGGYRRKDNESLRNSVDFFTTFRGRSKLTIKAVGDPSLQRSVVAVQHAPGVLKVLEKALKMGVLPGSPTAFRINEYPLEESGYLVHKDPKWQGTWFAVISMGSDVVLDFVRLHDKVPVLLPARSIAVFQGDAVTKWSHAISFDPELVFRGRRFAKVYRTSIVCWEMDTTKCDVILPGEEPDFPM